MDIESTDKRKNEKKNKIGIKPLSTDGEQPTQVREHKTNTRKIAVFISMSKKFARTILYNKLKLNYKHLHFVLIFSLLHCAFLSFKILFILVFTFLYQCLIASSIHCSFLSFHVVEMRYDIGFSLFRNNRLSQPYHSAY